jgi:hypothetical protein
MLKKVLLLSLVLLLVASLNVFGAMKPVEKKVLPSMEKMKPVDESIIYPYRTTPTLEPKFFFPMTDDTVGWTYYDYQDNASAHRRIAKDYLGNLHFTWMNMVGPDLIEPRYIDYNARYPDGNWLNPGAGVHVTKPAGRGGYTGLDILPDSREVLAFHDLSGLGGVVLAIEKINPGKGQFNLYDMPYDSIALHARAEFLHWPYVGTAKAKTGDTVFIHITAFGTDDEAGYIRCFQDPNGPAGNQNMICQSPGKAAVTFPPNVSQPTKIPYYFPADGKLPYISAPVVTSPTGSGRVAIVWFDQTADVEYQGEIYYLESTTDGNDWIAGTNLTPQKITHWGDNNWENYNFYRAEVAAVYDYTNPPVLHVFFTADATGNEGNDISLFHWSSATGDSLHKVASRLVTANCGNWMSPISKPSAGVEYMEGDAAYNYLYVVYSGYRDDDVSLAGFANADIYKKVSATGGRNWGPEVNLTNTNTDSCDVGNCESEAWSTVAERVDSFMYVSYVYDLDASGAIQTVPEGAFTLNPFRYLKHPRELVDEVPGKDFTPMMMISPVRWAKNGGTKNDNLTFANTGTATLYVKVSTPPYVTAVPNDFSIAQLGAPVNVNLTFSGAGEQDTFLVDQIMIESNNGLLGGGETYVDTEWVKFHFVVSNTFYYPEFDTVSQGVRAVVSNIGNIGNQEDGDNGNGMFYKGHNYLFEFTPVFVTPDIDTSGPVGFTWLHDNHDFLPEANVEVVDYTNYLKVTVVYDTFGLVFPGRLTSHGDFHSWWSYWTKYSKIMIFDYPPVVLVYNWWRWNPPPKWWDDIAPGTPAPGYFGIAADWDVPSKTESDNWGGCDSNLNLLYQYGDSAEFTSYYGAFQFLDAEVKQGGSTIYKGTAPLGAHVQNNATQLYPNGGFNDDSLYKYMSTPGWSVEQDSAQDMSMVMSMAQVTNPDSTTEIALKYALLVADGGLADLKAKAAMVSALLKCISGDANGDGKVTVSDVVYLINYLFKGGLPPIGPSDANGDGKVTVSDVVYLINYLFKGGPPPAPLSGVPWCE